MGAGPPHRSSRPAGPYAVRLTSRRTDAARAREKGEAASLLSPPPFCLCAQGGHGAPSFSVPVVSGEDGPSSFSFHLRFLPHSFLFPEGTKQQGNGGDAGRGGWGGRAACVVSAARGASSAASGDVGAGGELSAQELCRGLCGGAERWGGRSWARPTRPCLAPAQVAAGTGPSSPEASRGNVLWKWLRAPGLGWRVSPPGPAVSDFGHPEGVSL